MSVRVSAAGVRRLDQFLGYLVARLVWFLEKRIAAEEGAPPPGPLEETRERMDKGLHAAVAAANARERLRRSALIVAWAVQGCLTKKDAEAVAAYEARGRPAEAFLTLCEESELFGRARRCFYELPLDTQAAVLQMAPPAAGESVAAAAMKAMDEAQGIALKEVAASSAAGEPAPKPAGAGAKGSLRASPSGGGIPATPI